MSMYARSPGRAPFALKPDTRRARAAFRAQLLAGVAGVLFLLLLVFSLGGSFTIPRPYVILPVFGLTLCVVVPAMYDVLKRGFDPFSPVIWATMSYLFPVLVVGSFYLMLSAEDPFYMKFVPKPEESFPLTFLYLAVGILALSVGYQISAGSRIASRVAPHLPAWQWAPERLVAPSILLLLFGVAFRVYAFSLGITGYVMIADAPPIAGLVNYLAEFADFSAFFLWLAVFRGRLYRPFAVALTLVLAGYTIFSVTVTGGRAALLSNLLPPAFAWFASGRSLTRRVYIAFGILAFGGLMLGMVYGTTFRMIKGGEQKVSLTEYSSMAGTAVTRMSSSGVGENLQFAVHHLFERLEVVSSMAVIVANYERLRPLERQYKIDNGILTSLWAAFVPRFLYKNKPNIQDARSMGALYYGYGDNSFALSPMIDLVRNFGPLGVPVGMVVLGIVLSALYHLFWIPRFDLPWHGAVYSLLLPCVSYEAFYATIVSEIIRVLVIALAGGLCFKLWLSLFGRHTAPASFWGPHAKAPLKRGLRNA